MEEAPAGGNRTGAVMPFEVIDGTFPDFKETKGITVGHVVRKVGGVRESVARAQGKETRESSNNRAIRGVCSISEVKAT